MNDDEYAVRVGPTGAATPISRSKLMGKEVDLVFLCSGNLARITPKKISLISFTAGPLSAALESLRRTC